jgi:hypothetical protein
MHLRLVAFGLVLTAGITQAAAETSVIHGERLVLTDTLSQDTIITTNPSLSGRIQVSMDGGLSCLSMVTGSTAVISTSGCSDDAGKLRIELPPSAPVVLTLSGEGAVHIADTDAVLQASVQGSGNVQAGRVGSLILDLHSDSDVSIGTVNGSAVLDLTGSGDVRLGHLHGGLTLRHFGSGDLAVGDIAAGFVTIDSTGSGDMLIGAGSITKLEAHVRGSGDLAVAATVGSADVSATGGADIKLGVVTGHLNRSASGGSDVVVGGPSLVDTVISEVAHKVGTGEDSRHAGTTITTHDSEPTLFGHLLTLIFAGIVLYIIWRMVQRRGGIPAMRARFAGSPPSAAPTNPGVLAVCEIMARLDQRLARVETYVTSREFDLQRKFKDL